MSWRLKPLQLMLTTCTISHGSHYHHPMKKSSFSTLSLAFNIRKTWIKSPLVLLFASDVVCSRVNLSGYDLFLSPFTSFVALVCTFLRHSISSSDMATKLGHSIPGVDGHNHWTTSFVTKFLLISPSTCIALAAAFEQWHWTIHFSMFSGR